MSAALAHSDWSTIERYGRFLGPILKRIDAEHPETAKQIKHFRANVNRGSGGRARRLQAICYAALP